MINLADALARVLGPETEGLEAPQVLAADIGPADGVAYLDAPPEMPLAADPEEPVDTWERLKDLTATLSDTYADAAAADADAAAADAANAFPDSNPAADDADAKAAAAAMKVSVAPANPQLLTHVMSESPHRDPRKRQRLTVAPNPKLADRLTVKQEVADTQAEVEPVIVKTEVQPNEEKKS